jgi:hypothetical protein
MIALIELVVLPLILLIAIPIGIAMFCFWLWMLIHSINNKGLNDGERIAWVIVLVFVHFLGALLYFFIGRPKAKLAKPAIA